MDVHHARRAPAHAVDRPDLRRRLDAGLASPLSLIVAPAGAGKTVLLTQWARARPDVAIAWFDIAPADGAAVVFSRRLVDGIATVAPWFRAPSSPVLAADGSLGEALIEELAANLAGAATLVLVFDDLHHLTGTPLLTDLFRLIDLLPPNAHAVFSSRVDLRLGWSRHRLEHGLVEIRQRELAFDDATTAQLLEAITGHAVARETAAAVADLTEGWAVGVQLTALGLRFSDDPDHVVGGLSDTPRQVVDYLSEEVLDALEPARRTALMRLAVLDEVCATLATRVADVDGDTFLQDLERDSLFLVPVPGRPGWFRFHRLFRSLLAYRLRAGDHAVEEQILEEAAGWCLEANESAAAIDYLLRAGRWERAIEQILGSGRDAYEDTRTAQIAGWLARVPDEVRARHPDAELLLALADGMSGNSTRASDALHRLLGEPSLSTGRTQVALAYLAAEVQFSAHPEVYRDIADQAIAQLQEHPDAQPPNLMGLTSHALLTSVAQVSRARADLFLDRLVEAHERLTETLRSGLLGYAPYRVHALGSLALVDALSGRLVSAAGLADEALETARDLGLRGHPAPADAQLARAFVAIQRGEPEAGSLALAAGLNSAASNRRTQLMWFAHLAATLIHPELDPGAEPTGPAPPFVRNALTAVALRRMRMRGTPAVPPAAGTAWSGLAFEEVASLVGTGRTAAARERLAHFAAQAEASTPIASLERELLSAWLCAVEGRRERARGHLGAALSRAETERLVHPFVRVGMPLVPLLDEVPDGRSQFGRFVGARMRAEQFRRSEGLAEELTARERELLSYLPTRFTIADIADRCFVSSNTIKTHLGHIYRKLGVTGRDAAIERAAELGLLDLSAAPAAVRTTTM